MSSKHLVVHGTVQGVFFRSSAQDVAGDLGLAGWVRNRDDGSVEMHVEGDDEAVERMVAWAREGPGQADVTGVDVSEVEAQGLSGFTQE
jgi:acylphosphatase